MAIALAWFHQIPTGNELVLDRLAADYWRALYLATLALLLGYRVLVPIANAFRFRLRVVEVVDEGAGAVSLRIGGPPARPPAREAPGQFFLWRFLTRGRWWESHPFSLSAAPDGRSLRITIKDLGDYTSRVAAIPPGTRVVAEGPFGVFTDAVRRRPKVALIGGGIGIAPIACAARGDGGRHRGRLPGDQRRRRRLRRGARRARRAQGTRRSTSSSATTSPPRAAGCSRPPTCARSCPTSPSARSTSAGRPQWPTPSAESARKARVPSRYIHTERFAL